MRAEGPLNPALLTLPAAFGLAGASGLNATLPLLIVSLLARLGLVHLASPYDALASDIAFYGLIVLAVVEFAIDKIPALDSVGHAVMLPVAAPQAGPALHDRRALIGHSLPRDREHRGAPPAAALRHAA